MYRLLLPLLIHFPFSANCSFSFVNTCSHMAAFVDFLALCLLGLLVVVPWGAIAADEDPLQDVCVADLNAQVKVNGFPCKASASASDFVSPMLRQAGNTNNKLGSNVTAAGADKFPGLNTQDLYPSNINE
ncbi:hypothetical protein O6H91_07G116100 [Diphasiastrum complanatum]|uniref:Uncharacterized protein n=1 Tax=Diphasiastrum complanatum TaxID=34168 RepID=A0ACC2D9F0_DIPCM|nr:hypothetical protein O6H91_07G116100 [Diphasiastrum complanatum]